MTTTEEITVSGEDFIERRIFIYPQQVDMERLRQRAYTHGYKCGMFNGLSLGVVLLVLVALCVWCFS